MTTLTMEPPQSSEARPYWEATRDKRLVVPWCRACERAFWVPRAACPRCLGDDLDWREAAGTGEVHAVSVHHRPGPARATEPAPYAVALVELPEGVRMMSNVVGCPPEEVTVGMTVRLTWHELSDGRHLPLFAPAPS